MLDGRGHLGRVATFIGTGDHQPPASRPHLAPRMHEVENPLDGMDAREEQRRQRAGVRSDGAGLRHVDAERHHCHRLAKPQGADVVTLAF